MDKKKVDELKTSIRISPIAKKQLDELIAKLGENRSKVIVRAIGESHAKYCGK